MITLLIGAAISFEAFRFLEGEWCAQALGGQVIERWEKPFGDAMSGSMTVVRDGKVAFHEFYALVPAGDSWELRLKHFNPDIVSWEEREEVVVFPLIRATQRSLEFDGLTIVERAPGVALDFTVDTPDGQQLVFNYRKCE